MKFISGTSLALVLLLAQFGIGQDRERQRQSGDEIKRLQQQIERLSNALRQLTESVEQLKRGHMQPGMERGGEREGRPQPRNERRPQPGMERGGEREGMPQPGRDFLQRIPEEGRKWIEKLHEYIPEEGRQYLERFMQPRGGEREERREFRFSTPDRQGNEFFHNFDFEKMMPGGREGTDGGRQWEFDTPRGKLRIMLAPEGRDRGHEQPKGKAQPRGKEQPRKSAAGKQGGC